MIDPCPNHPADNHAERENGGLGRAPAEVGRQHDDVVACKGQTGQHDGGRTPASAAATARTGTIANNTPPRRNGASRRRPPCRRTRRGWRRRSRPPSPPSPFRPEPTGRPARARRDTQAGSRRRPRRRRGVPRRRRAARPPKADRLPPDAKHPNQGKGELQRLAHGVGRLLRRGRMAGQGHEIQPRHQRRERRAQQHAPEIGTANGCDGGL